MSAAPSIPARRRTGVAAVAFAALSLTLAACGDSNGVGSSTAAPGVTPGTMVPIPGTGSSSGSGSTSSSGGSTSGSSSGNTGAPLPPVTPPESEGTVPPAPAQGASRAGTVYDVAIENAETDNIVGITVFEPKTLVGGQRYPLILHSHGYSGSREMAAGSAVIQPFLDAGYGAISISERGSDNSTGSIRVMDPDFEGKNLLKVLDWAESLPWVQFGTGVDGSTNNLVVGAIGGSYGGMYQYLINNIDPRRRLDAITPEIAPSDLTYSLFPNNVIKAGWDSILFLLGNTAGDTMKLNTDPFVTNFFARGLSSNVVTDDGREFFYYHSNAYFCNGRDVVNNGTVGSLPDTPMVVQAERRAVPPVKTNALIYQGMRDTLFTFNNAYQNYQCLKATGGDVRLLSYQTGHNLLPVVPDPGNLLYENVGSLEASLNEMDDRCGTLAVTDARIAFFEQHLKGVAGAADKVIPTKPCFSITKGDAVLVDQVTTGKAGREVAVPATTVLAGGPINVPTAIPLGLPRLAGQVVAGIPFVELTVTKMIAALPGEPILFLGLGRTRNGVPGVYDLIDNQLTPIRGTGEFKVDLVGVAERLGATDDLFLLVYGQHDQYHVTGSINAAAPAVVPVSVAGKAWVPVLGNLPAVP